MGSLKSRDIIHHPGYDGNVFRTVEDMLEDLGAGAVFEGAVSGKFTLSGDISPSALSGNVDDYNPTGLATATILRIDGGASDRNITGIAGGEDGRVLVVLNIGTTNNLVLKNNVTSTAANRFLFNGDVTLAYGTGIILWYDSTSARWRSTSPGATSAFDISALTEDTTPSLANDFLPTYDTSAGSQKKVKLQNAIGSIDLVVVIGNGVDTITTGSKGFLPCGFGFTITGWTLVADQSGSIVIDVWKDTYANYPPTVVDTIAGSEKPTLSAAIANQDNSLSTWTAAVAADSVLGFNVDSVATVKQVTLTIRATKTS